MTEILQEVPQAELKRLLECLQADRTLLQRLQSNPRSVTEELGMGWDPIPLRKLWDPQAAADPDPPALLELRREHARKLELRNQIRDEGRPSHPRLQAWRERQVARCPIQLGAAMAEAIVHPPWCAELTRGCSVGCWFCGLSAVGLTGVYAYTEENARHWSDLLEVLAELIGPGARWGFCYWATDPLDNPDYEKFCTAFSDRLGMFPQTTTAQAWRHRERVQKLLQLSRERGCHVNRFSVLTQSLLKKLHQLFTAEEMGSVECVLQNREAPTRKASAGHARDPLKRRADKTNQVSDLPTTIACVTGFVFNMMESTVELVTPCGADERWPNGYYILNSARFQSIPELRQQMIEMIEALPLSVEELPTVRLAQGCQAQAIEDGLLLESRFQQLKLTHPTLGGQLSRLAPLLNAGSGKAEELSLLMLYQEGVAESTTLDWLKRLFDRGWLDEEPPAPRPA